MKDLKVTFLEAYKNLEDVLAESGLPRSDGKGLVASYEDTLPADSAARKGLQQCHIIRNSYQHENRTLFVPSQEAVDLLNETARQLDRRVRAKDVAKRVLKASVDDLARDFVLGKQGDAARCGKAVPVLDGVGLYVGAVDEHVLSLLSVKLLCIPAGGKKASLKSLLQDKAVHDAAQAAAERVAADVFYADLDAKRAYAVFDAKGAFKGMIQPSK